MKDVLVYLIYLPNYQHRWEPTLQNLTENGVNPILFHGIDAISWELKTGLSEKKFSKNFTSGRIGCFLSHFMLWNHLYHKDDWETVMILEDDVRIDSSFNEKLGVLFEQLPQNWDFLYLGSFWGDVKREKQYSSNLIIGKPYCTHAYMFKKRILSLLMEKCYNIEFYLDIQIQKKVLPYVNYFVADPPIVDQESLGSSKEYESLCKDWKTLL